MNGRHVGTDVVDAVLEADSEVYVEYHYNPYLTTVHIEVGEAFVHISEFFSQDRWRVDMTVYVEGSEFYSDVDPSDVIPLVLLWLGRV